MCYFPNIYLVYMCFYIRKCFHLQHQDCLMLKKNVNVLFVQKIKIKQVMLSITCNRKHARREMYHMTKQKILGKIYYIKIIS